MCTQIEREKLYVIDQAIKRVTLQMNIADSHDRVWTLVRCERRDYCNALRLVGFVDLYITKLYIAI